MPIGGEYVLRSIVIEIVDAGAPARQPQAGTVHSGGLADIQETRASEIPEKCEAFVGKGRHQDVVPAIVVIIAEIHSHTGNGSSIAVVSNPGLYCNLLKASPTQIVKQEVWDRIVGDQDVRQS